MGDRGVVVGFDGYQEWLLPWWWKHYSRHSDYPVAFVDFGMSEDALAWCATKGVCIKPTAWEDLVVNEDLIPTATKNSWEEAWGSGIWATRPSWFKKPFACQQTPFTYSLWLDIDCQVRGSLTPIFDYLTPEIELVLHKESKLIQEMMRKLNVLLPKEVSYNPGVLAFHKGSKIIDRWVELVRNHNEQFIGDREALSRAIALDKPNLVELPSIYNWNKAFGDNPEAVIYHFQGGILKMEIVKDLFCDLHFGKEDG